MRFWQYSITDNFLGMRHQLICHKASRNRTSEGAFSPYFLSPTAAVGFFQRREEGGGEPLFPRLLFLPNYAHRLLSRASARVACQLAAQSAVLVVFLAPLHLSIAVAEGHPERERELSPEFSMDFLGRLLGGDGRTGTERRPRRPLIFRPLAKCRRGRVRSCVRSMELARGGRRRTARERRGSPSHFNACKKRVEPSVARYSVCEFPQGARSRACPRTHSIIPSSRTEGEGDR